MTPELVSGAVLVGERPLVRLHVQRDRRGRVGRAAHGLYIPAPRGCSPIHRTCGIRGRCGEVWCPSGIIATLLGRPRPGSNGLADDRFPDPSPRRGGPHSRRQHVIMLTDAIRSLFGARPSAPAEDSPGEDPGIDPLHLAACVLLLDIAHADGEFSESEKEHLEEVLERHFSLPPETGRQLLELAERERHGSVDYFRFTSQLQSSYDLGQKMVLAEIMWGLVLADGEIAEHEQYLTRKISNLLSLQPGYLSAAKAAASRSRE
jgi:uncharacterized tellurite resistance protein B-like protein